MSLLAHCQSFMPLGLRLFGGPILPAVPPLPAHTERFAPVRRDEYYSGRRYGLLGLASMGADAATIPTADNGAPVWPQGIVGSITHTRKSCIVALSEEPGFSAVGIDLEMAGGVTADVHADIMSDSERQFVGTDRLLPTVMFSAKESFFKLCRPRHYIDFLAVEVAIDGNNLSVTPLSSGEASAFAPAHGTWCQYDGEVFTALHLPQ